MRTVMNSFCLLLTLVLPLVAVPASAGDETDEKELRRELAEARKELNEAARRVGELTRELGEGWAVHFDEVVESSGKRAMLGVGISPVRDDGETADEGLRIMSVTPGGPADEAGLRSGDILIGIDDIELDEGGDNPGLLTEYLAGVEPGDSVEVKYRRGNDESSVDVTTEALAPRAFAFRFGPEGESREFRFRVPHAPHMPDMPDMPDMPKIPRPPMFIDMLTGWGRIDLVPVSEELGSYFGVDRGLLVVRAPEEGSVPLRDGDVILKIGNREPDDVGHALRILRSYKSGEKVEVTIMREGDREELEITMPERSWGERLPGIEREFVVQPGIRERSEPAPE